MRCLIAVLATSLSVLSAFAPSPVNARGNEPKVGPVVPFVDFPISRTWGVEGISMSPHNDLYVDAQYEGIIFKVEMDGTYTIFASGLVGNPDDAYLVGLIVAGDESLYVAAMGCNDLSRNGVWHVDRHGRATLAMSIPTDGCWSSIPNHLAFDEDGNLYATDSIAGAIWRLGERGDVSLWTQDPLLLAPPTGFFGANGIAYRDHSLWVNVSDAGAVIEVPILRDGRAGRASTFVQSDLLVGIDDSNFDAFGYLLVGNVYSTSVYRISPRGQIDTLIAPARFGDHTYPNCPVFGFGKEARTIFITGLTPNVVKVDIGIPGMIPPQFEDHPDRR